MQIDFLHLSKEYDSSAAGPSRALCDVSFSLHSAEVFGVLGPAGAGKSTLLAIVGGHISPTAGQIYVDGHKVEQDEIARLQNMCRYLRPTDLSTNTTDAAVVLMDEPDLPPSGEWLHAVTREQGKVVVLGTRSTSLATELCDRLMILCRGRLIARMSATELLRLTQRHVAEIRVRGYLENDWSDWFSGLTMTHPVPHETVIRGPIRDQTELHGILNRIRDLSIPLISVSTLEPDLEQIIAMVTMSREVQP